MSKIKEVRKERGFVLQKLMVAADVSSATLNAIEKYGYVPKLETQKRIALALGVEVQELWPQSREVATR